MSASQAVASSGVQPRPPPRPRTGPPPPRFRGFHLVWVGVYTFPLLTPLPALPFSLVLV